MMGSATLDPEVKIQFAPTVILDTFEERASLILGQTGTGGTARTGSLVRDVHLMTEAEIKVIFGSDDLYWRIKSWRDGGVNVAKGGILPPLDVIGVSASPGGKFARNLMNFRGAATAAGEIILSCVDEKRFKITLPVAKGETVTNPGIAKRLSDAIAELEDPPFSVFGASLSVLRLEVNDAGTIGHYYGISLEINVPGMTELNSMRRLRFSGGANNPSVTSIFDAIEGIRYTNISWPESWQSQLGLALDEMDSRFNVSDSIMDGVLYHGRNDTFENNKAAVSALNSPSLVMMGNNTIFTPSDPTVGKKGGVILTPADWVVSDFMGTEAKRLTTGSQIDNLITAITSPLDDTGGASFASLPYFNTLLRNTPLTSTDNLYSKTEQLELEKSGFSHYGVNRSNNTMVTGAVVTTFTTNSVGDDNDSLHYLSYRQTGSVCREIFFKSIKAEYSQSRLTQGDLKAGFSIINTASIKTFLMRVYRVLSSQLLVQSGSEAEQLFSDNTTVEIIGNSLANRSVTITGILPIVTQFDTINYNIFLSFSFGDN